MALTAIQKEKAREIFEQATKSKLAITYQGKSYSDYKAWDELRVIALREIQPELKKHLAGSGTLLDLRDLSNRFGMKHNLWGFTGYSGQMVLNQIAKHSKNHEKSNALLRKHLVLPSSRVEAAASIRSLAAGLRENPIPRLRIASVPFVLSYFWQLQDPGFAPIYYSASKDALQSAGLFEPGSDLGQSFLDFWQIHDDLAELLYPGVNTKKENKYWLIEHVLWTYQKLQNAESESQYSLPSGTESVAADSPDHVLSLIGTWKEIEESLSDVRAVIKKRGSYASVWSFFVKDGAKDKLRCPFYVYINVGRGVLKYRMRVDEFKTSKGGEGIETPWPDITDKGRLGSSHDGDFIYKTWFKVSEIEEVRPPLNAFNLKPAEPWTKNSRMLLHQNTFGYFLLSGESQQKEADLIPYSLDDAAQDMFVSKERLGEIVDLLRRKKNVILQGPPGVGKSFVAKRLAYALIGAENDRQVGFVQFHQSYSYEDFIQGYRPTKKQSFELAKGVFYRFCEEAKQLPQHRFVFIIDEINRGNLSRIFGELMLLIESDKRGKEWGATLAYSDPEQEDFYVPENVYILGLMNTADRSLALVDYALRRRFAFVDIEPGFESDEFGRILKGNGASASLVEQIRGRMAALNAKIRDDKYLGRGFEIGHSYFCPGGASATLDAGWYNRVIRHEIGPLLREYWSDHAPKQVEDAIAQLIG